MLALDDRFCFSFAMKLSPSPTRLPSLVYTVLSVPSVFTNSSDSVSTGLIAARHVSLRCKLANFPLLDASYTKCCRYRMFHNSCPSNSCMVCTWLDGPARKVFPPFWRLESGAQPSRCYIPYSSAIYSLGFGHECARAECLQTPSSLLERLLGFV